MKPPVLHAEPDCSPARATRWRHGRCSLALLCSLARQKRYLAAVWLARFFAVWLGIWLQSGCFWLFLAPFLPFLPFWLAVWLRCFCSLALFCCSLAFFSEPDCKSGARLQNNGARLQVREPDCKKKEPDCKKTAVRLFAVRLHNSSCRVPYFAGPFITPLGSCIPGGGPCGCVLRPGGHAPLECPLPGRAVPTYY